MDSMMNSMMNAMATATNPPMPTGTEAKGPMGGMGDMDFSCKISMLWNWYTINSCFISHAWKITSNGMFAGSCIGVILLVLVLEALRRLGREYDKFIVRRARLRYIYLSDSSSSSRSGHTSGVNNQTESQKVPTGTNGQTGHGEHDAQNPETDLITPAPQQSLNAKAPREVRRGVSVSADATFKGTFQKPDRSDFGPYRPSVVEQLVRALLHTVQFAVAYFIMLLAMYYNGYIIICIFIGAFIGSLIFSWEPVSLGKENDATAVTKCCG